MKREQRGESREKKYLNPLSIFQDFYKTALSSLLTPHYFPSLE